VGIGPDSMYMQTLECLGYQTVHRRIHMLEKVVNVMVVFSLSLLPVAAVTSDTS